MKADNDLIFFQKRIFELAAMKYSEENMEAEGKEYLACSFKVEDRFVRYRQAKVTPTKIGQFVTIWKRSAKGPIEPFDRADPIDLLVVTVKTPTHLGQFIFPKSILISQGVLSVNGKGGKRAFRVYPSWDTPNNKQAEKSQSWQLKYFAEVKKDHAIDLDRFKALYLAY